MNVTRGAAAVMVMISSTFAPLNSIVSLPISPLRMSLSSPGFQIITSSPLPPFIVSLPSPPVSESLPSPPFSVSASRPPRMVSSVSPPVRVSMPSPPSIRIRSSPAATRPFAPVTESAPPSALISMSSVSSMSMTMLPRLRVSSDTSAVRRDAHDFVAVAAIEQELVDAWAALDDVAAVAGIPLDGVVVVAAELQIVALLTVDEVVARVAP